MNGNFPIVGFEGVERFDEIIENLLNLPSNCVT